jgi:hypothetical protein
MISYAAIKISGLAILRNCSTSLQLLHRGVAEFTVVAPVFIVGFSGVVQ